MTPTALSTPPLVRPNLPATLNGAGRTVDTPVRLAVNVPEWTWE